MRRVLTGVFRLVLRIFFRAIEVEGLERLPPEGPLVLVLNHPNGLLDPLLLVCASPRPVSFLAKAPLFRTPVIGSLVRALDSIPVHRRQDPGTEMERNRETFDRAASLLAGGGVIALFPEGVSHDEPRLQPLKTGAARIALGVTARGLAANVVAVGLTYTAKQTFRSEALVWIGEPFQVPSYPVPSGEEPPREAVEALTARMLASLEKVTLQAKEHRILRLAAVAGAILGNDPEARSDPGARGDLAARIELRQLILARWAVLERERPEEVAALERRVARLARTLEAAGLDPEDLSRTRAPLGLLAAPALATLATSLLLLPLALAGILTHWPAYRLTGILAGRFAREEVDIVSTVKVIAALVLFPASWAFLAFAGGLFLGLPGVAASALVPACGLAALLFSEQLERAGTAARAVALTLSRGKAAERLRAEQEAIRGEMLRLAAG